MTEAPKHPHDDLETLFSIARSETARPVSAGLMARIEADALAHLPQPIPQPAQQAAPARRAGTGGILALLGGWPVLGGFATAAAAGFWIGFAVPSDLIDSGFALTGDGADTFSLVLPDYSLSDTDGG